MYISMWDDVFYAQHLDDIDLEPNLILSPRQFPGCLRWEVQKQLLLVVAASLN